MRAVGALLAAVASAQAGTEPLGPGDPRYLGDSGQDSQPKLVQTPVPYGEVNLYGAGGSYRVATYNTANCVARGNTEAQTRLGDKGSSPVDELQTCKGTATSCDWNEAKWPNPERARTGQGAETIQLDTNQTCPGNSTMLKKTIAVSTTFPGGRDDNKWNSCGNCWIRSNDGVWQYQQCLTAVDEAGMSPTGNVTTLPTVTPGPMQTTATAFTVASMRSLFEKESNTGPSQWNELFCSSYLDQYKDGRMKRTYFPLTDSTPAPGTSTTGNQTTVQAGPDVTQLERDWDDPYSVAGSGAACVRARTVRGIREADSDARNEWIKWGSGGAATNAAMNGYPSGFAVVKGEPGEDYKRWGTGWSGDLPTNWCSVFMKQMFCHMAFPQVRRWRTDQNGPGGAPAMGPPESKPGIDLAWGQIRAVSSDSVGSLFEVCSRRQPTDDEVKVSHSPMAANNTYARMAAEREGVHYQQPLKNGVFKVWWSVGLGLAKAGPGVQSSSSRSLCTAEQMTTYGETVCPFLDKQGGEMTDEQAAWSGAGRSTFGLAMAAPLAAGLAALLAS